MERKCYLQSFLMKLMPINHLSKQQHLYVVFTSLILFREFVPQAYLSSKVPQVSDMNGFRAAIALYMAN